MHADRSSRAVLALALAIALVSAGCSAPVNPSLPAPSTASDDGAVTPTPADSSGWSHPWGPDPVVVGVDADGRRNVTALVREAADYWEEHDEAYVGYPVTFEVRPDAADPDVVVHFVDDIPDCSGANDAVGCAPRVTSRPPPSPANVYVEAGYRADSTVHILQHEFGHVLGLGHDAPPQDVMAPASLVYTLPQTNATDRAFPWGDASFTVYVDARTVDDETGFRRQVGHAMGYFERDPAGAPSNLTFRTVDSPDAADVVVTYSEASPCGPEAASCASVVGNDPDGDGAIETYTRLRITLVALDTDAVGWHVGYWLAHYLGAEADADKPAPFRDATYEERRSEWWR